MGSTGVPLAVHGDRATDCTTKLDSGMQKLQSLLVLAYAISLPLSMTASWAILTTGLIAYAVQVAVIAKRRLSANAESETVEDAHDSSTTVQPKDAGSAYPLAPAIAVFALIVAISGLFNGGAGEAWRSVWSLKAILCYFWASFVFWRDRELAIQCVQALLTVGALAGIWGTIQQVFNYHPFGYRYLQGTGFLGGPMAFAGQMQIVSMVAVAIVISGAYSSFKFKMNNKWVFLAIALANVLGLIFAGERSAWLGGLAGSLAIASLFSFRLLVKAAVGLALVGIISWFTVPLVHTRVESMLSGKQDVSTRVRYQVWNQALASWHESPVVGIGFLKFPHLDIPEAIVPGKSKDINHAHSNYLQMLSTTGVLGLLAYVGLCLSTLFFARRQFLSGKASNDPLLIGFGSGLLGAMVSLMVAGIFEYNFGTAQVRLVQWFVLGFLSMSRPRPVQEQIPEVVVHSRDQSS